MVLIHTRPNSLDELGILVIAQHNHNRKKTVEIYKTTTMMQARQRFAIRGDEIIVMREGLSKSKTTGH